MIVTIFNFHLRKKSAFYCYFVFWHDSSFTERRTMKRIYLSVFNRDKQILFLREKYRSYSSVVICQMGWMGRTSLPCLLSSLAWLSPAGSAVLG